MYQQPNVNETLPAQGEGINKLLGEHYKASRLFRWIGVRGALFILPCLALGGYALLAVIPLLEVIRAANVLENGCDYSDPEYCAACIVSTDESGG